MNANAPTTPSSGRARVAREAAPRGAAITMSERHVQAYLVARDAVRRVQRTAWLFDPSWQSGTARHH